MTTRNLMEQDFLSDERNMITCLFKIN